MSKYWDNKLEHEAVLSSIIAKCTGLIKNRHGLDVYIESLRLDDAKVYELINTDTSTDVFGLEASEYHGWISWICPTEIRHIEALHAMSSQWMRGKYSEYINNKDNPEIVKYHSEIEQKILEDTYGVVLYTDQIKEIIHRYSGIPEDVSANIVKYIRKCMKPELSIWRSVFIVGVQKKGLAEKQADEIWEWLIKEGETTTYRYMAESEAVKTYQCYWLKSYYPDEYKDALIPTINTTK